MRTPKKWFGMELKKKGDAGRKRKQEKEMVLAGSGRYASRPNGNSAAQAQKANAPGYKLESFHPSPKWFSVI